MSLNVCWQSKGLSQHVRQGLQALGKHAGCVQVKYGKVSASVDLDSALAQSQPNEPRWDYGVEVTEADHTRLVWIEVHPAISSEVDVVLRKLRWLRDWLNQSPFCQAQLHKFYWVATAAGVHIDTATRRRLSTVGLKSPTRRVVV